MPSRPILSDTKILPVRASLHSCRLLDLLQALVPFNLTFSFTHIPVCALKVEKVRLLKNMYVAVLLVENLLATNAG